jgi:Tfp pilus assembly protein PilF
MIAAIILAGSVSICTDLPHFESGGDYTNPADRENLGAVEDFHFTRSVETLTQGVSGTLGADINYTLERFPNHHRALAAMAKLALREETARPRDAKTTIDCYFERALRMNANDATVHSIYGGYLLAAARPDEAFYHFTVAAGVEPENATVHYNLGLLYLKRKDFEQARVQAKLAYQLGFPLPGLKNRLIEAHHWDDAAKP